MKHKLKKLINNLTKAGFVLAIVLFFAGMTIGTVYSATLIRTADATLSRFDAVEISTEQPIGGTDEICTTSTTYEDIPGMSKTFQQGGLAAGDEVIVMANMQIMQISRGYMRLVIDNVPQTGTGAEIEIGESGDVALLDSWNFVSDPVSRGTRTAKLQWRSDPGHTTCMFNRTMIVLHR